MPAQHRYRLRWSPGKQEYDVEEPWVIKRALDPASCVRDQLRHVSVALIYSQILAW